MHKPSVKAQAQIDLIGWNCVPPKQIQGIFNFGQIGMGVYKGSNVIGRRIPGSVPARIISQIKKRVA
jgi:hypothetical protein